MIDAFGSHIIERNGIPSALHLELFANFIRAHILICANFDDLVFLIDS